jgi:sulfate transport system permease protein
VVAPTLGAGRRGAGRATGRRATGVGLGLVTLYLSLIVLLPLGAVLWRSGQGGVQGLWASVRTPDAWAALELTVAASVVVALLNAVLGTLVAWVLVRDNFPGKRLLDMVIDLPFALPTIVAGIVLLALYGPETPVGLNLAYTRAGVALALLFVTLPFVVRTVQPVLLELDHETEEAAHSLGASRITTFRRVVLPNIVPAVVAGTGLAFARALSEFGSTVLISGNIPLRTQVSAVHIFGQVETDNISGAAAEATVLLVVALVVVVALGRLEKVWKARG